MQNTQVAENPPLQPKIFRRQFWLLLPMTLGLLAILALIFTINVRSERLRLEGEQQSHVDVVNEILANNFQVAVSDLLVLAESTELRFALASPNPDARNSLANRFLSFSEKKGLYDQVRFLDLEGNEIVRVNYNNGSPSIVPANQLQNKDGRYYFEETVILNRGEIFVSPLDLNVENGEVEEPLKPMIRFGTPIFDSRGEKRGILLFNYFGDTLLGHLDWFAESDDALAMLMNADGYWLLHPDPAQQWGFMYEERQDVTFSAVYPEAWERIQLTDAYQFYQDGALFTGTTVYPLLDFVDLSFESEAQIRTQADYRWHFISYIPPEIASIWAVGNIQMYVLAGGLLQVGLIVISYFLAALMIQREQDAIEIRRHRDHLEELVAERTFELDQANHYLQYANEEMRNFTSIVSHDLRSPVASIRGFLRELVRDWETLRPSLEATNLDDRKRRTVEQHIPEAFDLIDSSLSQMERLTGGILKIARAGRRQLMIEQLDPKWVVESVVRNFGPLIRDTDIIVQITGVLPVVKGDKLALEQIFSNLIGNAIKYRDPQRPLTVTISAEQTDNKTIFHVKDTGSGIAQEHLDTIFRLYRRGDVADIAGEGIGLYAVRGLVRRHGGELTVTSEVGVGSTFTFYLVQNPENNTTTEEELSYA